MYITMYKYDNNIFKYLNKMGYFFLNSSIY